MKHRAAVIVISWLFLGMGLHGRTAKGLLAA